MGDDGWGWNVEGRLPHGRSMTESFQKLSLSLITIHYALQRYARKLGNHYSRMLKKAASSLKKQQAAVERAHLGWARHVK